MSLHFFADLHRGLVDQEQAADDQDQVLPGDRLARASAVKADGSRLITPLSESSSRMRMIIANTNPNVPRLLAVGLGGQAVADDGDEDDVVNAQYDLQRREREQADKAMEREQDREVKG